MIFFIYGENTYFSQQKLQELKDKFIREVDPTGENLNIFDGSVIDLGKINEAIALRSLFVRKRMVVIKNIFTNKNKTFIDQLPKYLQEQKDSNDNIIIFFDSALNEKQKTSELFKFLSAQNFVQNFKSLSNTEVITWVKKEIEKQGVKITMQVATHFSSLFASNLWQLSTEIEKLVNYKKSLNNNTNANTEIELKDIELMSHGVVDENIFAMTDAISNKNKSLALELLEKEINAGVAEYLLIHMIMRQFKILLQLRQALDVGHGLRKVITDLRLSSFVVQKTSAQARNFDLEILKNIYFRLIEIDYLSKTGQGNLLNMISLFLVKI